MQRTRLTLGLLAALALGAGGCGFTVKTRPQVVPLQTVEDAGPVAFLGTVDLRLARGGGQTHRRTTVPAGPGADDDDVRLWPYPLNSWNRGVPMLGPSLGPSPRPDEERLTATGELGPQEVAVPLEAGFVRRWVAVHGRGTLRDATGDALAQDPEVGRVAAFLGAYPVYSGAVWLEVVRARAQLPDLGPLPTLLALGTLCTAGVAGLLFLVPVRLDTPVDFAVRGYKLDRKDPRMARAASVTYTLAVEARGSPGFDVDDFRAALAAQLAQAAGEGLAQRLSAPAPLRTTTWPADAKQAPQRSLP